MIRIPAEAVIVTAKGIYPDMSDRALEALTAFSEIKDGTIEETKTHINRVMRKHFNKLTPLEKSQVFTVVTTMRVIEGSDEDE